MFGVCMYKAGIIILYDEFDASPNIRKEGHGMGDEIYHDAFFLLEYLITCLKIKV
jgi:hypothetical protein